MGMGSHRGLSLLIFCPLGLSLELLSWSVGLDVVLKVGEPVGIGCRRLGRSVPRGKWLIFWTNGRGTCWFGRGDEPRGWTDMSSNKLVNLANCSLTSWINLSWAFSMTLSQASHWSPIFFNLFGNKFDIKHLTWCIAWYMHAWYEKYKMTCYAKKCLINHD